MRVTQMTLTLVLGSIVALASDTEQPRRRLMYANKMGPAPAIQANFNNQRLRRRLAQGANDSSSGTGIPDIPTTLPGPTILPRKCFAIVHTKTGHWGIKHGSFVKDAKANAGFVVVKIDRKNKHIHKDRVIEVKDTSEYKAAYNKLRTKMDELRKTKESKPVEYVFLYFKFPERQWKKMYGTADALSPNKSSDGSRVLISDNMRYTVQEGHWYEKSTENIEKIDKKLKRQTENNNLLLEKKRIKKEKEARVNDAIDTFKGQSTRGHNDADVDDFHSRNFNKNGAWKRNFNKDGAWKIVHSLKHRADYYLNSETGRTQWEIPEGYQLYQSPQGWVKKWDLSRGCHYYANIHPSVSSQWNKPKDYQM